jgi:hypothetical protein
MIEREDHKSQNPVVEKISTLFILIFLVAMFLKFLFF